MGNGHLIEVQYYLAPNGKQPFTEWFESIQDKLSQARDIELAKYYWRDYKYKESQR